MFTHFTLIGRPTTVFVAVRFRDALPLAPKGHRCPSVKGVTLDGKRQTFARVVDVVPVPAP